MSTAPAALRRTADSAWGTIGPIGAAFTVMTSSMTAATTLQLPPKGKPVVQGRSDADDSKDGWSALWGAREYASVDS